MNNRVFKIFLEQTISTVVKRLETKGKEYAKDVSDRLSHFKRGGIKRRTSPEDYLMGLAAKPELWVEEETRNLGTELAVIDLPEWDEKIIDKIVYSILLYALITERFGDKSDAEKTA